MYRHLLRLTTCSLLVLSGLYPSFGQGTARAVVDEPIHDFGTLYRGARVSTTFVIENRGDAELVLERVSSNCACLVTEYEDRIPAGGKGELAVELDTLVVQGPVSGFVKVSTNDAENPNLQLTIRAMVENVIGAVPGDFQYSTVQGFKGRAAIGQLLWSPDGTPFRITRIESPIPELSVTYREATAEERQRAGEDADGQGPFYWVEAVLSPEAPVGPLGGFLKIYVDHPQQSVVPLPVSGFQRPVFAVTPHEAHLGSFTFRDEPVRQDFFVKNFATETIPITKVETDVPGLAVTIREEQPGRTWIVSLTLPMDMPKGPFAGSLTLHTASERAPVVTVPLSGTVR